MNVSKDQIIQLLESQGDHGKAQQVPDQVDTDNPQHAGLLFNLGVDKDSLGGQLGGLGKTLCPPARPGRPGPRLGGQGRPGEMGKSCDVFPRRVSNPVRDTGHYCSRRRSER